MDLTNYLPLEANVWGTVSDWMMVGVTAITAIYLVRTFKSQQIIQSLQQETLRIDSFHHRENLKPHFSLTSSIFKDISDDVYVSVTFKFVFDLKANIARNIKIDYVADDKWKLTKPVDKELMNVNDAFAIYATFEAKRNELYPKIFMGNFKYIVYFSDTDEHDYHQTFAINCFSGDIFITPEAAELIQK